MSMARRALLQLAGAAVTAPAFSRVARAQTYPTRPITMIVPFVAGGPTSVLGRVVAERMRGSLGQVIIIENVGGADGTIGVGRAARARPDGYTILLGASSTQVFSGEFYSLQCDVLNDFQPVALLVRAPLVLYARKTVPAADLRELIAWLRSNPDRASAGSFAASTQIIGSLFQRETGTHFTLVPYRGSAPMVQDLVAGQIDLGFDGLVQLPLARSGAIRAYAGNGEARSRLAPELPTFAELGLPSVSRSISWWGLLAPRSTPREIVGKLNAAAVEALADPLVQSPLAGLGFEVFPGEQQTPEALGALVRADAEKWWPIIKELGIKPP